MEGWTGNADDMTLVISPTARLGQTDERSNWELDTWMPMFCGLVTCGYIAAIQPGDGYLLLLGSRDCPWGTGGRWSKLPWTPCVGDRRLDPQVSGQVR